MFVIKYCLFVTVTMVFNEGFQSRPKTAVERPPVSHCFACFRPIFDYRTDLRIIIVVFFQIGFEN